MILKDSDITARLESPLNLINKLNRISPKDNAMSVFIPSQVSTDEALAEPEDDPINEIIDDKKIRLALLRTKALDVLSDSLDALKIRLPEISKVKDLSSIARDMKVVLTEEDEGSKFKQAQVVIYKPVINDISKYDTLVVSE